MKEQRGIRRKFPVRMQKKLVFLFMVLVLAFIALVGRLYWIVRENENGYQKQVLSQQRYDSATIPYRRGDIVDAKGTKLAVSEKVYNLVIDSKVMLSKDASGVEKYLEPTLEALGSCFADLNMTELRQYITGHPDSSWYVPLKRLTYDQIGDFQMLQAEENSLIRGVWFEEEYMRMYPNGSLAADVIGFSRSDNQGLYGLEEYYNDVLNGTTGREYGYLNDDSALERTIKPAVDGYTVHSTIDVNVQSIVEKYLLDFNEQYKNKAHEGNGAENVGCVIMEVNTGKVLAMASYPTFDLNDSRNTDALIGSNKYVQEDKENGYYEIKKTGTIINEAVLAEMTEDEIYVNLNNLWKNFCITNTYEPGSTIKPFTVAAALECGAITGNEHYTCNGSLEIGGHTIHCHNVWGDGDVTVEKAIESSCNVALMKIGQQMGKEEFARFQEIFNFGLKTNVDLAGEARTASLMFPVDQMGPADLATNTFGQNFNVTMIQMISGFCSLINGGNYYEPHMVDKITNANGATIENIEPRVLKQTVSESTSALIRQYCKAVVVGANGTGKTARPAGYVIGGKTGTAQTLPRGNKEYVVSFMGFAPVDDPQIAIYVVVDRANAERQDDAKYATRIVRNILTEVLPYLNIFMTEELSDDERKELEEKQLEITNMYTRKPEDDALENLEGDSANEGENIGEPTGEEGTGEGGSEEDLQQPKWMSFPVDPGTGYRVDPETGKKYDADTGDAIEEGLDAMGSDIPSNPNIVNPPED